MHILKTCLQFSNHGATLAMAILLQFLHSKLHLFITIISYMLFCSASYFSCLYRALMIPYILKLLIGGVKELRGMNHVQKLYRGHLVQVGGTGWLRSDHQHLGSFLPGLGSELAGLVIVVCSFTPMQPWIKNSLRPVKGSAGILGIGVWVI